MSLNILNCNNYFYIRGGSDKIFFDHMKIMDEMNHTSIPFAPKDEKSINTKWDKYFTDAIDISNPEIKKMPNFFYNVNAKKNLEKLLFENSINIAHLHIYYGRLTTSILDVLYKKSIPIIQTLHDYKLICPNNNLINNEKICEFCNGNLFFKSILKKCNDSSLIKTTTLAIESHFSRINGDIFKINHFIAVSEFLKKKLVQYGLDENKISVVHNPIDISKYKPNYNSSKYFLYFGRIEKIKGIKSMIEAAIKSNIDLKIVGDGNEKMKLENEYNGNNKIEFLGFKTGNELKHLIQNSLVTICPSICYDIFPTSILESFAYGKPVIGSNIGGIPELVENNINGYLYDPGNIEQLSSIMNDFKKNPKLSYNLGINARSKVEEKFNKSIYYQKIMKIYSKYTKSENKKNIYCRK